MVTGPWNEMYQWNRELFSKEGFTLPVIRLISGKIRTGIWVAYHLFYYGKRIPDGGTYLELGSFVGGSLLCIYEATKLSGRSVNFIAIDSFVEPIGSISHQSLVKEGLSTEEWFHRFTGSIPRLTLIKETTDNAKEKIKDNSVDLIFIDAGHTYEEVTKDLINYWPKLKKDGVLLGHDYRHISPKVVEAISDVFGRKEFVLPKNAQMFMVTKKIEEMKSQVSPVLVIIP